MTRESWLLRQRLIAASVLRDADSLPPPPRTYHRAQGPLLSMGCNLPVIGNPYTGEWTDEVIEMIERKEERC